MFVFTNPTDRNITSSKNWKGLKSPWIGAKNIWNLFVNLDLIGSEIYNKVKSVENINWIIEQELIENNNNKKEMKT